MTHGAVILFVMQRLKAVVRNSRLTLDVPTDLPEGANVELAIVEDGEEGDNDDGAFLEELRASERDEAAGNLVDFDTVIARLGTKPREVSERLASLEGQARLATDAAVARDRAREIVVGAAVDSAFLSKRVTT